MLLAASLSLFLGLGSSLVAASPLSNRANTTLVRGCATHPSKEFIDQAEAHFAKNKVWAKADAIAAIPVYCTLVFLGFLSPWWN